MATATKIWLTPENIGAFSTSGLSMASAHKVSQVLQHDMENHHIFFNDIGYHNHTVHYMLSIWALGASPDNIEVQYRWEEKYQRPAFPRNEDVIRSFSDKNEFKKYMHQEEHYSNYLAFFQSEINSKGVGDVLNEYLFGEDHLAESLLSRMFASLVHPLIHLGFGIEFQQPAIVAQALAQAAVHEDHLGESYFWPAEKIARSNSQEGSKTLIQIMDQMRSDRKVAASIQYEKVLWRHVTEDIVKYCSQWTVSEDQIYDRLVEMVNAGIYWTATAQNPNKQMKIDFFYIHATNSSIFFKIFMDLPYLSTRNKARLLEMKGRMDLIIWASGNMPKARVDDVNNYSVHLGWPEIFVKAYKHPSDDGHLAKFIRTIAHAEGLCQPYVNEAEKRGLLVTGDMWLKIANMAVDSVGEIRANMWSRGAGFEESWERFGPRK